MGSLKGRRMCKVIDLAQYKKRRPRVAVPESDAHDSNSILIELQIDGTHRVTVTGAYTTTQGLAIEAVADVLAHLLRTHRSAGGFP